VSDELILVVDDDPLFRSSVAAGLEFWGFRVSVATNGQTALLEVGRELPALVLLDINMPVLDGRGFAREIADRGLAIPIIVVTSDDNGEVAAREIGAAAWISKPFDLGRLFRSIERVMRSAS